jgi:hypothetical protein
MTENILLKNKHILICPNKSEYLEQNFCGTVLTAVIDESIFSPDKIIYLCGDINNIYNSIKEVDFLDIYVIKNLSTNYNEDHQVYKLIDIGKVPINICDMGIYFPNFFDSKNYFNLIKNEHEFQTLTESNKLTNAFRKGIYLSKIESTDDILKYNLLRCSSNLNGPTDNFRKTDEEIIDKVNNISQYFFTEKTEFNHVLAQIYINSDKVKAKIKAHSDKTKDITRNGLIAFCTFYDDIEQIKKSNQLKIDGFDFCYKQASVLTKLYFKLKHPENHENLVKQFNITLYPNSVFIIPMSTNRLYTHEIRPSNLSFDKIPTRLGYVIRCSKTKAIFKDNQTYIDMNTELVKLREITDRDMIELRKLYYEENSTDKIIEYANIDFSMNSGDYIKPLV